LKKHYQEEFWNGKPLGWNPGTLPNNVKITSFHPYSAIPQPVCQDRAAFFLIFYYPNPLTHYLKTVKRGWLL
jgi:hypothetical protein